MKRIWIIIVVAIAAFVGIYFGLKKTNTNAVSSKATGNFEEYTIKPIHLIDTVSVMGRLSVPDDKRYEVRPYISGVVSKVFVEEEQRVTKGKLLAELDDKTEKLDYLRAKNDYENALLGSSKQLIEQRKLELAIAEDNLSHTRITSPIDGKVYYVNVREGDRVGVSTTMFVIVDDSELLLKTSVDEIDYSKVKLGQPVLITLDAFEGKHLSGKITEISPEAVTAGGLTTIPIEITVAKTNRKGKRIGKPDPGNDMGGKMDSSQPMGIPSSLRKTDSSWISKVVPGLSADGEIVAANAANVLAVPIEALGYEGNKTFVLKKGEDGQSTKTYVDVGLTTDEYVEIISGLKEGDVIFIKYSKSALQKNKPGIIREMRGIVPPPGK